MDGFGAFCFGAGIAMIGAGIWFWVMTWREKRRSKFDGFIDKLKSAVEEEKDLSKGREVSELMFRDKQGIMNTVRIIVDHDLMDQLTKTDIEKLKVGAEGGTLDDILHGHSIEETAMNKVQEFVFSPKAVQDMRNAGLEPDEVVTKMLRASGRMA